MLTRFDNVPRARSSFHELLTTGIRAGQAVFNRDAVGAHARQRWIGYIAFGTRSLHIMVEVTFGASVAVKDAASFSPLITLVVAVQPLVDRLAPPEESCTSG